MNGEALQRKKWTETGIFHLDLDQIGSLFYRLEVFHIFITFGTNFCNAIDFLIDYAMIQS